MALFLRRYAPAVFAISQDGQALCRQLKLSTFFCRYLLVSIDGINSLAVVGIKLTIAKRGDSRFGRNRPYKDYRHGAKLGQRSVEVIRRGNN
jgi:hypothetical protein